MSEFSRVLSAVESESIALSESVRRLVRRGLTVDSKALPDKRCSKAIALSAYERSRSGIHPVNSDCAPPSAAEFYEKLALANGSKAALRALRREIAWRLHPDRRTGSVFAPDLTLAQCNRAIDAALERCGARFTE